MPPVPAVLSCLGTSVGLNAFGLVDTLPVGPIFPDAGDAVFAMKCLFFLAIRLLHIDSNSFKL